MSAASRVTLGVAVSISAAIIGYVHYKQSADRLKLHDGVLRDVEQQQRRKHENTYTLQQQIDITRQLKTQETSGYEAPNPSPRTSASAPALSRAPQDSQDSNSTYASAISLAPSARMSHRTIQPGPPRAQRVIAPVLEGSGGQSAASAPDDEASAQGR